MAEIQPDTIADLLLIEVQPGWTKDKVTIGAGADLVMGQVLGKVTASGKFIKLAPAAADGSQIAAAVLVDPAAAAGADVAGAVVIARGAVVDTDKLVWPAGITAPQKATALGQLQTAGIVARTTV